MFDIVQKIDVEKSVNRFSNVQDNVYDYNCAYQFTVITTLVVMC